MLRGSRLPGPWGGKLLALGAVASVAILVAVIVLTSTASSPAGAANSPSASSGSATVQRRDLVATDTEAGTLSYADPQTVYNRVSGTVTWLPTVGQTIYDGQTLYEIDNAPVVLFNGTTPAFRTLDPSVSAGPDVLELNRDLLAMGFAAPGSITVDDTWQSGTTTGVERWQASLGETETGTVTLGEIVFLPGAQRVTTLDTTLGSTGGGGGGGGSNASNGSGTGASTIVTPRPEFVDLTTTFPGSTGAPRARRHKKKKTGKSNANAQLLKAMAALLKAESAQLRAARPGSSSAGASKKSSASGSGTKGSASSSANGASSSGAGASATAILNTTSTKLIVTVDLDASKQSEAKVGEPVTVQLPDNATVNGKITAVSPVAQSSSSGNSGSGSGGGSGSGNSSSGSTIPVTIALTHHISGVGLDQAAVSVNFEQQVANNVLSVPVTSLLATQGGGYAVQEGAPPHRLIPVNVGLFAAGYVQVSGPGIYDGLAVTDSQG